MEDWMESINTILNRTPTWAMPFSDLIGALREEGLTVADRERWILKRLAEHPETFRIIPHRLPFSKCGSTFDSFISPRIKSPLAINRLQLRLVTL